MQLALPSQHLGWNASELNLTDVAELVQWLDVFPAYAPRTWAALGWRLGLRAKGLLGRQQLLRRSQVATGKGEQCRMLAEWDGWKPRRLLRPLEPAWNALGRRILNELYQ